MNTVKWQGVYPALLTPFKKDDSIDFEMFEKNLLAQIEAGIDGAVLGGSLGEASTLTKEEITYSYLDGSIPFHLPSAICQTPCRPAAHPTAKDRAARDHRQHGPSNLVPVHSLGQVAACPDADGSAHGVVVGVPCQHQQANLREGCERSTKPVQEQGMVVGDDNAHRCVDAGVHGAVHYCVASRSVAAAGIKASGRVGTTAGRWVRSRRCSFHPGPLPVPAWATPPCPVRRWRPGLCRRRPRSPQGTGPRPSARRSTHTSTGWAPACLAALATASVVRLRRASATTTGHCGNTPRQDGGKLGACERCRDEVLRDAAHLPHCAGASKSPSVCRPSPIPVSDGPRPSCRSLRAGFRVPWRWRPRRRRAVPAVDQAAP